MFRDLTPEQLRATQKRTTVEPLVSREGPLALSFAQQRLWFLAQMDGASEAYHLPQALSLDGPLDREALARALDALVARHEALRTRFVTTAGEAFQQIDPADVGFALQIHDLTDQPDAQARLAVLQQEEATAPFDLVRGPLARGRLVVLAADRHVLLLTLHHIVSDGWSMGVLTRELGVLYAAFSRGEADPLPPLPVQYADYAAWQRQWLSDGVLAKQVAYWTDTLATAPGVLELPADRPRPAEQDYRGGQLWLELDEDLTAGLKALSQRHGSTLYMTLLAAWAVVLSGLSGQTDVVIGTPTANRRRTEFEGLIGFFVNTLALRIDLSGTPTVAAMLGQVRDVVLSALEHQDLPFEQVVELVNPTRSLAYTPLFQTMFAWQNNEGGGLALPGIQMGWLGSPYTAAKFDLTLSLAEERGRIVGGIDYATALFDTETVERYIRYLRLVLAQMVERPDQPASALTLLDEPERHQLLVDWNDTGSYPAGQTIQALFETQAARKATAVAVVCEGQSLTYGELNARANRLAHYLREQGVGPDKLVAICVERSLDMVVSLLAVLKAGGAYVPLDPAYPAERLAYTLRDSAPTLLLTHGPVRAALDAALAELPAALPVIDLDADADRWAGLPPENPDAQAVGLTPRHLAYVIYTSGSTGQPKGVMVEHANVVRLFSATAQWFHFGPEDVWTLFHSFAFDFSVWEIWGALLHGGRLVVVPKLASRTPADFYRLLCEEGVTVLNQTPSAFRSLVGAQADTAQPHRLRTVIFGGEALDLSILQPWYRDARNGGAELVNMYGITETTVHVTYRPLTAADAERPGPSPIGRRIDDLRIYLLDTRGEPVPVGAVGELYVGGAGVARGYLNRPELTAERFIDSPFVVGDRLYKTGDLGRYRTDGSLEYVGRNDFQVKIRGFRIELGEIEARLAACPGVREAVVLARQDVAAEPRLVGYYTVAATAVDATAFDATAFDATAFDGTAVDATATQVPGAEALRTHLAAVLPDHMVPAAYVRIAAWPLTANGKLDRQALPAPDGAAFDTRHYVAPEGPIETALAAIWAEVLGIEQIGRHDHFFALGGHSLLALRVLDRMRRQGLNADVRALFGTPSLAALAAAVGAGRSQIEVPPNLIPIGCARITPELLPLVDLSQDEIDAVVATVPGGAANVADIYPLAPLQEGILFHHLIARDGDPYLVSSVIRFADRDRFDRYRAALEAMIARHDILRTSVVWEGVSEPVQVVWRQAPLSVEEIALDPAGGDVARQMRGHFDDRYGRLPLHEAPLLRLLVTRDPHDGQWLVLELIHHIIDDNTTLKQLKIEIRAHLAGRAGQLPQPLPFRNFIAHTRRGVSRAKHETFFRKMLGEVDTPTAPFDMLDVRGDGHATRQAWHRVDTALSQRLRSQARALRVSAASLFHVAWAQVLARTSGRQDVVFGTVLFGRMQSGVGSDRILGPFINTLPLRITLGETGAADCVQRTHLMLTGLLRHEHASLVLAQSCSAVIPPAPLFTALLNYRHSEPAAETHPDSVAEGGEDIIHLATEERSNYPLTLDVDDEGEDFRLTMSVCGEVEAGRVCAMMRRALETLVEALEQAPQRPVGRLDVLPPDERHRLLDDGNPAPVAYPPGRCLHQLFEAHAERDPGAVALVLDEQYLSYGELNARANRLAHHLRAQGVGPDRLVAVCVERSPEMVVGLLAVLKAGGAYVPLDPAYPAERLAYMLRDSTPVAVLTHGPAREPLRAALTGAATPPLVVDLDLDASNWAALPATNPVVDDLAAHHLAYVIYTSGTTAAAKGVLVEHGHLVAVAAAWEQLFGLRPGLVHLQMASFSFDVFTADVVRALGFGGRLVLCPRALLLDSAGLYALVERCAVDFADFVPAVLNPLMTYLETVGGSLAGLETLVCGSEAWTPANARQLRALCGPAVRIVNAYGVTEAAVDSSYYLLPADGLDRLACLPIGRPLPNARLYLLDEAGEPVPIGVAGEIHVGGAGVARGYLNRPELTAERFVDSPFVVGDRLYKTGDLGRWLPDGNIEFLGRNDFQVKIRGFRVELGEVESRLVACPGVREAVVLAREDTGGDRRLVAYYLADEQAPGTEELRDLLATTLPEHMVPAAWVRVEAWPLTPNGKLDRKALPAPGAEAYDRRGYVEPVDLVETVLAALWAEVLGVGRVGRHDHFFALGGHSLLAMRLASKIRQALGREVSPAALFAAPTLAAFAERLVPDSQDVLPPIEPLVMRGGPLALSFAQQRLWFLAQMDGASEAYHMPQALNLHGVLDRDALTRALDALVARHEALRTRFVAVEGEAFQQVDPADVGFSLQIHDLTGDPDGAARLATLQREEATAPFDLVRGPLARGRLVVLAADRHVLLLTLHHIVSDGWSMGVLTRELGALYAAFRGGDADPLSPLKIQYADYAAWQRQWLSDDVLGKQAGYWTDALATAPALLELPTDRPRPAEQDYRGGQLRLEFDEDLTAGLKALSQRHGGTLFMTLLAAWAIVASRLSGQTDVVIGTPTANRRRSELEGLIGFFVNTLALRIDLSGTPTVAAMLDRVRGVALAALEHQDLPFERVVELVNPTRNLAYAPLFQTMFAWENNEDGELALPGVRVLPFGSPYTVAKFDLTLSLVEDGGRIVGGLDYATALFDAETAERYGRYLHRVLAQMVERPDQPASALTLLDEPERHQLLVDWNETGSYPAGQTIQALFETQVARKATAVAVVCEGQSLTYGELNTRANRLAHHLRAQGVGPDKLVAICVERSLDMVIGLVAILKAGGAYVPLDPAYPAERLAYMLRDSAPTLLLTQAHLRSTLPGGTLPVLCLDADEAVWVAAPTTDPVVPRQPDHLAYVIYTSGSTGRPKGVAQTWRSLDNLIDWQLRHAAPDSPPPANVLQFASISFDVSVQEIWSTLCQGATLVLMGEIRRKELGQLRRFIAEQAVQRAFLPAAVLQQVAGLDDGAVPRRPLGCEVITAGEALRVDDELRALLAQLGGARLYNQYGPTETHVVSQHALVCADAVDWPALPPIGRPIAHARLYVLDGQLEPVPVGVIGELYIGGVSLARGYLGRPGLTAEKFLPDPFASPGARMYRSGDLARRLADGNVDYVGRADSQVKLRGFRVEPGEVESVLQQATGVREAAVLMREDAPGDRHLVAYLAGEATVEAVREQLRRRLPDYMVPTRWVTLERLPLTPNGKLDRRALPAPDQTAGDAAYQAPRNEREAQMAAIWAEVLRRERVGVHDDFFALGGHSLLATRLIHTINQRMSAQLSLRNLFQKPVLADLAAEVARGDSDAAAAFVFPQLEPDLAGRYEPFPLTDIQEAYWVGREATIELGGVGAHGYSELRMRSFDEERFTLALNRLIARHDMLRAVFHDDGSQRVLETVPAYRMPRQDLRGLDPAAAERRLGETRERMSHQLLDAGRWPLFEFALTLLDGEVRLHVSIDALIVDAASSQILERELMALYADPDAALPPLALSFRDYVLAERALRETPRYERALRYWRQRAAELAPAPGLPLARQPETIERPRFTRYDRVLPAARWSALKAIGKRHAITPSVLLLTAFAQVLALWSRQPRFTLSLPLFNRLPLHPGINAVIGDFTSLVLLEVEVAAGASFVAQARAVQERLWQDIDHAAVSGVRVNRELSQARGTRQTAMPIVFNSTLSELAPEVDDRGLAAALDGEALHSITQTPQVWIDHTILESEGRLYFNWDSIDELFPEGLVAEMFAAYGSLLARLEEPEAWQSTLDTLLPVARFAPPAQVLPAAGPLMHELFERQACSTPSAPAVLSPDRQLSYGTLRREARHLAGRLQERGARPGQLVAVMMERGWEQVVATLAILYAGGAYLPIDPEMPVERVAHLLERAEARLVLLHPAQMATLALPDGVERVAVDAAACGAGGPDLRPVALTGTDLAYVIYTSGSTGTPKGVVIDHRGAVNTLLDINERFAVGPADRVLAISSLSFDLSVYDFFGTLAAGGAVVTLAPELARDPAHWLELLNTHRVSVWNSVPALLGMLVEYAEGGHPLPPSLRLAMLSGDWIPLTLPGRLRRLLPGAQVDSLGGATEASIWSIHYPIDEVNPAWRSIPYGKPLKHQRFYVLDEAMRPRPIWVPGELYIGGIGLAQGYWRDEARTAASFVTHPVTGERLYRTGDLGRLMPDGNIEFLGREDGQVKVHGYRVELGEIEAALESHPAVRAAVLRLLGEAQDDKRLAAYVVAREDGPDGTALAQYLARKLPAYMVPTSFTFLDALPLSANGKVDKGQLPEPAAEVEPPAEALVLDGPAETRVIAIVEGILKRAEIAPRANLLLLGATSIDIVRIGNALSSELGFRPRLAQLMRQPTLADLLAMYREHVGQKAIAAMAQRASAGAAGAAGEVVDDPKARKDFKARGQGRRSFDEAVPAIALAAPVDPAFTRRYADYRSVRQFSGEPVAAGALAHLLACLSQSELDGTPKHLYGSAGGSYPVQTYLYIKPGRVAGVAGGAYYHDPYRHRLVALGQGHALSPDAYDYFVNRPVFEAAAFALFLVAEMAAIEPLYGQQSLGFCQIEAGSMAQLLTMAAVEQGLGLCGIGSLDADQLDALFELGSTHRLVYSMVGGLRRPVPQDALSAAPVGQIEDTVDAVEMEDIEI